MALKKELIWRARAISVVEHSSRVISRSSGVFNVRLAAVEVIVSMVSRWLECRVLSAILMITLDC